MWILGRVHFRLLQVVLVGWLARGETFLLLWTGLAFLSLSDGDVGAVSDPVCLCLEFCRGASGRRDLLGCGVLEWLCGRSPTV